MTAMSDPRATVPLAAVTLVASTSARDIDGRQPNVECP
jgi:hypothetical protein